MFNAFPFPWTVSAVHVVVGLIYCTISYFLGFKKASFGRVSPLSFSLKDASHSLVYFHLVNLPESKVM